MPYLLGIEISILQIISTFMLEVWIKTIDKIVRKHLKLCKLPTVAS